VGRPSYRRRALGDTICSRNSFALATQKITTESLELLLPNIKVIRSIVQVVLFTLFATWALQAISQSLPMAPDARPFAPVEESTIDSFTVANDSILVSIPIWSIKERGQLSMDFTLRYTTPSFQETQDCLPGTTPCLEEWGSVSSLYGVYLTSNLDVWMQVVPDVAGTPPVLTAWYWEVITPDSGTHKLALVSGSTNEYRSIDGTGWIFNSSTCTATNEEGIQFVFSCTAPTQTTPYPVINHLSYVQDTNGNRIQMNYSGPTVLNSYTDTLGQTIAAPPISLASISFQNNVGGQATTDFSKCASSTTSAIIWTPPGTTNPIKFCYSPIRIQTNFFDGAGSPDVPTLPTGKPNWKIEAVSNQNFLSTVVMPSGLAWNFAYAGAGGNVNYGNLTSIGIATGGTLSYNWGESFVACGGTGNVHRGALGSRTLDAADGNGPQTWTYSYTYGNGNASLPTAESTTDPLGNKLNHTLTANNCSSYETEADYIDSKLGLLKTVTTQYEQLPTFYYLGASTATAAELPKIVTTTMFPGGSTSQTTYSYDAFSVMLQDWQDGATASVPYGVATNVTASDFGSGNPGAVLRQTNTSYMALNGPSHASYLANNLLTLPYTVQVTDGSGTQKSLTTYGYDESGYVANSSAYDGNLTTMTKWLNTGGSVSSHIHYDPNGMPTETDDPRTNPTTYTYQCSGALLHTAKNALNQITTYGYDCNSRLLTSIQDPNDAAAGRAGTTFSYNSANDLQGITYPDSGSTTFNYNSYALPLTVTKTVVATPDPSMVSSTTYDGLGRVSSSTAPNGAIATTTYDKDGRVNSISNPHFSTPSPTTFFVSDALGRKTLQTQPDSNTQSWTYTGNAVTFKDESGNQWKRTSDGLGRLIQVLEPSATSQSPSVETDYAYDTLNNLTGVNQLGASGETPRSRGFTYDSLSRLITASNPETGTVCYGTWSGSNCVNGYDSNGNLVAKTDARGITVSYGYEALNRMTLKTASDGSFTYQYMYDLSSTSNSIGRLSYESNDVNASGAYNYDPMGRVTSRSYCVPSNCSLTIQAQAKYDLAGNMTSQTYPDGRTITQGIDRAGRISSVSYTGWAGNGHSTSYLNVDPNAGYDAAGHLTLATMGNGLGIQAGYDSRERIQSLLYGTSTDLLWGKYYGWTPNSNLQTRSDAIINMEREFTYDPLNRLTSAQDIVPSGGSTAAAGDASNSSGEQDTSNTLPNAQAFNSWIPNDATVAVNMAVAPDGSKTAALVTGTTDPNNRSPDGYIIDFVSAPTLYDGQQMNASVWLRSQTGTQLVDLFIAGTSPSGTPIIINWKPVTLTTSWQQFQVVGTNPSELSGLSFQIGGGASVQPGNSFYVWGAVLQPTSGAGSSVTNFLPYSQRTTASTWAKANNTTTADNTAIAPDGTNTAATVTATGGSDTYIIDYAPNPSSFDGASVVASVYLRVASGTQNISLYLDQISSSGTTPIAQTTVTLTTVWQRVQFWGTAPTGLSQLYLQIGGGGTIIGGDSFNVWGAQIELGTSAGFYVQTGAVPVTQGANLTNILPFSQQPNGSSWEPPGSGSVALYTVSAPDGTNTGATLTAASGSTDTNIIDTVPDPSLYDGAKLTASVYLRASVPQNINLYLWDISAAGFNPGTGVSAAVTTNWQRFEVTRTVDNGLTQLGMQIGGADSMQSGQAINLWGAQMEVAPSMGPYVATSATPVTTGSEYSNILPFSQQLNGANWGIASGSVVSNSVSAPDGTMTGATLTANSNSTDSYAIDNTSNPWQFDGTTVTSSVYLRANANQNVNLYLVNNGGIVGQPTYAAVTTQWQRFQVTGTVQNGLWQLALQIGGAGSLSSGQSINVWGAQMVEGTSPEPYTSTSDGTTNIASGQAGTLVSNGLNETYSYDSFGNLQQNGGFNANFPANNQMFGYAYDPAGNLLSNGLTTMTWDAESKLTSTGGATYIYSPEGDRVEKQGVGVTDTIFFGGRPIARFSNGAWTDLIYGPNGLFAEVAGTETALPNYRLLDHLGNQIGTVGSTILLTDPLDYTPFGQVFSGSTNDPYMFTSKERDGESGLDYFGARYLSSSMGRFMSPDWAAKAEPVPYAKLDNPQSLNLYAYAGDNPLRFTDLDGHAACQGFAICRSTEPENIAAGEEQYEQRLAQLKTLPDGPSGLGEGWTDVTPQGGQNPKIPKRYRGPKGSEIEFDPADPDKSPKTWGGKNHWHEVGPDGKREDEHLAPGSAIPGPDGVPDARVQLPSARQIGIGIGGAAAGYLIYRGLRMLPSVVIPALWPTIPLNAAIP
jgi:RHS repeat-associated protein